MFHETPDDGEAQTGSGFANAGCEEGVEHAFDVSNQILDPARERLAPGEREDAAPSSRVWRMVIW